MPGKRRTLQAHAKGMTLLKKTRKFNNINDFSMYIFVIIFY